MTPPRKTKKPEKALIRQSVEEGELPLLPPVPPVIKVMLSSIYGKFVPPTHADAVSRIFEDLLEALIDDAHLEDRHEDR